MVSTCARTAAASALISFFCTISPITKPNLTRRSACSLKISSDKNEESESAGICCMSCSRWRFISSETNAAGTSTGFRSTKPSMICVFICPSTRCFSSRSMFFCISARRLSTVPSSIPKLLTSSSSSSGKCDSLTSCTVMSNSASFPARCSA